MTDELDRIRTLRDAAPGPSASWVHDTRAELLALAAEEEQDAADPAPAQPGRRRGWLGRLVARPRRVATVGAAVLVLLAAVGAVVLTQQPAERQPHIAGPTERGATPPPDAPAQDQVALGSSCQGGDGTYTIGYPEDWHTNSGEVIEACQRFDEEPVELEADIGGAPEEPVVVNVLPVALDVAADAGEQEEEHSRTNTTVAGRDAVIAEWTSTGDGAVPEGTRSYRYLVELDDERTLMIAAFDLGDGSFDEHREVVDAMAQSLELHEGETP